MSLFENISANRSNEEFKKLYDNIPNSGPEEIKKFMESLRSNPEALAAFEAESESDSESDFISKTEVELEKLETENRYLKLDLNNQMLTVTELQEKLEEQSKKVKKYESTLEYVKSCLKFLNNIPKFNLKVGFSNVLNYNQYIIESTRRFDEIRTEYRRIQGLDVNDGDIKKFYHVQIVKKYDELEKSFQDMNNSLKRFLEEMKILFVVMFLSILYNIFTVFF